MKTPNYLEMLLVLFLVFALCSCSGKDGEDDEDAGIDGSASADADMDADTDSGADAAAGNCLLNALETFDTTIPTGWTVVNAGTATVVWIQTVQTTKSSGAASQNMTGGYAAANSLLYESLAKLQSYLVTETYQVGECVTAKLSFDSNFIQEDSLEDIAQVEIKTDVADWQVVETYTENLISPAHSIDLSKYLSGASEFQLRFYYHDGDGHWFSWSIDNVKITGGGG
jgi:hypothetical protein